MTVMARYPYRVIHLIICVVMFHFSSLAQPKADFIASNVSGCAPIVVHFTDKTAGSPTQWRWDLGNGVVSNLQNPSSTYFNPGTYSIKLVVRNAAGADSVIKTNFITVFPNPSVNFKASDSSGCFPLHVQFSDLSSTTDGSITSWGWDFGDGTTSSQTNPSHTYTSAGNFTVTLRITNSFGCTKTFSKNQYIKTTNGVKAGFTNNAPGTCKPPVSFSFTNTSTGPGAVNYTWDFGDGTTSNALSPVHQYAKAGTYSVSLVAVSSQGCSDTLRKENLISIGDLNTQFDAPISVCAGQEFLISNSSVPAPGSASWSFGDGSFANDINPVKKYNLTGTYTIKLVNNFGGCLDSTSKNIIVKAKPQAAFIADKTSACQVPATIQFINQSTGSVYAWKFGDGGADTYTNPAHTYTAAGAYTVTLVTSDAAGCSDTLVRDQYINVKEPVITIANLPATGCAPITINPVANVTSNEAVVAYLWKFGDGTTSTAAKPVHTYATSGTYHVSLTITTAGGCTQTLNMPDAVRAGNKPKANFTLDPADVCAFKEVSFTDQSTGNPDQWYWDFGDGTSSIAQNPLHEYQDTGWFNVTLVAMNNTCTDTLLLKKIVHVKPPIAAFGFNRNCSQKYRINFEDHSLGALTYQWFFGDGNTSAQQNPVHDYAKAGSYVVILNVTNGSCTHTTRQTILVVDEKADFTIGQPEACKGTVVSFKTKNINAANIASLQWDFGNGSGAMNTENPVMTYAAAGTYPVTLTITDILGCTDAKTMQVKVYGPSAKFEPTVPGVCIGTTSIFFTDQCTSDGVNPVKKWIWNYGDGMIDSSGALPFKHFYPDAGVYDVTLTVVDDFGCRDSLKKTGTVTIAKPVAAFNSPDTLSCTGKTIQFNNTSSGYDLQAAWTFGDGTNGNIFSPDHAYADTGVYDVRLLVTDKFSCKDSLSKLSYVMISYPKAGFTMSDSVSACPPLKVDFKNTSSNYRSLSWDFGDGNTSVLEDPSHYYTTPGIYFAKLTVTSAGGCIETFTKKIEVRGPRGSFTYQPPVGCNPLTVTFNASTLDRLSFIWDFSDGNTDATTDSVVTHTYMTPGDYVPKMILLDASGCSVPITGADTIHVMDVKAGFEIDKFTICDAGMVNFKSKAVSNDLINSYQWNFGDGGVSNLQNPSHQFANAGSYDIQLLVTTFNGCKDSVTLNDTIHVYDSPVISISGDTTACLPAQLNFTGVVKKGDPALLKWNWDFDNGQKASTQNPAAQLFGQARYYNIVTSVTDDHGCTAKDTKPLLIHPLPVVDAGPSVVVCRGDSVKLNATGAVSYTWLASPGLSCTNCASPFAKPTDTTKYFVKGISQFGCANIDSVLLRVRQHQPLKVAPGDSICAGSIVHLQASGTDQYNWSPSTGLDNANIANPVARPMVSTTYKLVAKDNDNCFADTASVYIHVTPIPDVNAGADTTITVGAAVQLKPTFSADVTSWQWTPSLGLNCASCPDPVSTPKQNTTYTLQVKNNGGCIRSDEVSIFVLCNNGNLFIPNTFTPNGDGSNDRFYPRGNGIAIIRTLRVFNRWGEMVFERTNFNVNDAAAGWDGMYKGKKLDPDVYVYTCEVACENNVLLTFKGDIALLQ